MSISENEEPLDKATKEELSNSLCAGMEKLLTSQNVPPEQCIEIIFLAMLGSLLDTIGITKTREYLAECLMEAHAKTSTVTLEKADGIVDVDDYRKKVFDIVLKIDDVLLYNPWGIILDALSNLLADAIVQSKLELNEMGKIFDAIERSVVKRQAKIKFTDK